MANVLIIEDEARIAAFMAKGLRSQGHSAVVAGDGRTGLKEVHSGRFDLVLLDLGLPDLDGTEVLDQLRSSGSTVPVVVLTARDSAADPHGARYGGADGYLAKPFRFADLLTEVRARLGQDTGTVR